MKYTWDPSAWQGVFAVPAAVADQHLKLASPAAIKTLLYAARHGLEFEEQEICRQIGITPIELNEALLYWQSAGLLTGTGERTNAVSPPAKAKRTAVAREKRATRLEIARRADEAKEIALILQQAEIKFARPLKETEKSSLVYILDDLGMNPEIVLMLLEHAAAEGRTTSSFLESTAVDWINRSIDTVALAEQEMTKAEERKHAWAVVRRAMSIESRRPSAREAECCVRWVEEWQFSEAMLRLAYDQCVDNIGKLSFPYVEKILKNWHASGVSTPEAANAVREKRQEDNANASAPSFDLSLF